MIALLFAMTAPAVLRLMIMAPLLRAPWALLIAPVPAILGTLFAAIRDFRLQSRLSGTWFAALSAYLLPGAAAVLAASENPHWLALAARLAAP
jgi:hypothetical protein